jgi:hypothetical protein
MRVPLVCGVVDRGCSGRDVRVPVVCSVLIGLLGEG